MIERAINPSTDATIAGSATDVIENNIRNAKSRTEQYTARSVQGA